MVPHLFEVTYFAAAHFFFPLLAAERASVGESALHSDIIHSHPADSGEWERSSYAEGVRILWLARLDRTRGGAKSGHSQTVCFFVQPFGRGWGQIGNCWKTKK